MEHKPFNSNKRVCCTQTGGLLVRIRGAHCCGPGSITGHGMNFIFLNLWNRFLFQKQTLYFLKYDNDTATTTTRSMEEVRAVLLSFVMYCFAKKVIEKMLEKRRAVVVK